jgi:hypothetical protein
LLELVNLLFEFLASEVKALLQVHHLSPHVGKFQLVDLLDLLFLLF